MPETDLPDIHPDTGEPTRLVVGHITPWRADELRAGARAVAHGEARAIVDMALAKDIASRRCGPAAEAEIGRTMLRLLESGALRLDQLQAAAKAMREALALGALGATVILDLDGTLPDTFSEGNWPRTTLNSGKFRFTWTPAAANSDAAIAVDGPARVRRLRVGADGLGGGASRQQRGHHPGDGDDQQQHGAVVHGHGPGQHHRRQARRATRRRRHERRQRLRRIAS